MRMLGQKLGLWRCVWLLDFDGEWNLRIARRFGPDGWSAIRMGPFFFPVRRVSLLADGKVRGATYVKEWRWADDRTR